MRKNQLTKLPKLSIDMRNKNLSVNDYYKQITGAKKVQDVSWWTYNLAFWRIGQLLSNAELNLKEGYTDLCKRLSNDDIIRVRDQQRFKKLARSRRIQKIIMKAPPKHTVLSWLDSLTEKNFKKILPFITRKSERKELENILNPTKSSLSISNSANLKIKRTILQINQTTNPKNITYKQFKSFVDNLTKLKKQFKFFNYDKLNDFYELKDQVQGKNLKQVSRKKLKDSYSVKSKIKI
jgi:hypothetical protein|tara:strand:+ start:1267 stop:1977 length:711 start_codon:yes stop_codon:yes gene_type:complete